MATNPILDMVASQGARTKSASDLLVGSTIQVQNKMEEVLTGMSSAVVSQGNNQAIVLQTQMLAKQEAERKASRLMELVGGEENLFRKVQDVNVAGEKLKTEVADMQRLRNTSFFGDGPIDWFMARLELPKSQLRVQDNVMATQAARSSAIDLNNAIQETVKTTNATTRTVSDLSINAATNALNEEYKFKAGQVQLDMLRNSLMGVEAIAKAEEGALRRAYDSTNLALGERQWALTLERFKNERENQSWIREEQIAKRAGRLEQQQFDETTRFKINLARNSRGEPPLEGGEWQSFKEFTPKDQIGALVRLGEQAQSTGIPFIANSPADTAKVFLENPNIRFEDTRQKSAALIFQALNDLGAIKGSKDPKVQAQYDALIKDKSGQQAESYINSRVRELITTYTANTDAPTNPFNLGDIGAFLGDGTNGISTLIGLEVSQKVLIPAVRAGVKLDSPGAVIKLLGDAVKAREITSSVAASGISSYYLRANELHRSSMGLRALGIIMPEEALKSYRATVGGKIIDMTDQVQVSRAITEQMFGRPGMGVMSPVPLGTALIRAQANSLNIPKLPSIDQIRQRSNENRVDFRDEQFQGP